MPLRRVRWSLAAACLVALSLSFAASALGDADPASDELIGFDSYYPYAPQVSKPLQQQLDAVLRASRKSGHVYKVVLIEAPPDLGAATVLYGKTQRYATFLYNEIHSFLSAQKPTYLIVTKQGTALRGRDATPAGKRALAKFAVPANASSDQLAQTALKAVQAVETANGHPVSKAAVAKATATAPHAKSATKSKSAWIWVIVAVAVVIAGACAAWLLREWRRSRTTLTD
jgi:hypothetical protein